MSARSIIRKRYDFVFAFDVKDGNPNGDPDAGNLPRIDLETGQGLVSNICLKRKIRNYVLLASNGVPPNDIFVRERTILNQVLEAQYAAIGINLQSKERREKGKAQDDEIDAGRKSMCDRYFDVRTFGAVMTTGPNAGQVRGPVQFTFARSIDPIATLEHTITRVAASSSKDAGGQGAATKTFGRKATVSYGLYVAYGFISPALAARPEGARVQGTGFSEADVDLLWKALENMFDHDRSAARGLMTTRAIIVFEHASALGDAQAQTLFSRVNVTRDGNARRPARAFSDYVISVDGVHESMASAKGSAVRYLVPAAAKTRD